MIEDKIISFGSKSLLENPDYREKLFAKKARLIDDFRPDENDFTDIYNKEIIEADLGEIKRLEAEWAKGKTEKEIYNNDVASLLEGVLADQAEANAWFGENCQVVPASRYDDIRNGVDVVNIFKDGHERNYVGLGVDVTFASDIKVLTYKLDSVKNLIKKGSMPTLKYFQDPDTNEHRSLSLPKVIIGARLSSAEKLITLWGGKDENKNKKLATDPMQSKIIVESLYQLMYFYEYANKCAEDTPIQSEKDKYKKIAVSYATMYNMFYEIFDSKKELIESHASEIADDIVYQTIKEYTGN